MVARNALRVEQHTVALGDRIPLASSGTCCEKIHIADWLVMRLGRRGADDWVANATDNCALRRPSRQGRR